MSGIPEPDPANDTDSNSGGRLVSDNSRAVGVASGLGCSIVVSLVLFIGLGVFVDQRLDTAPVFILIGVAIGLIAAGYQLYELTLIGRKDRPNGPVGRVLERRVGSLRGGTRR